MLARVLDLSGEIGVEEESALDRKAKLERVIRKFRQEKAGEDWVKVLTEALKSSSLHEKQLSDEVRSGKNSCMRFVLGGIYLRAPSCPSPPLHPVFSLSYPNAPPVSSVDTFSHDDKEVKDDGAGMARPRGGRTPSPDTPTSEASQTPASTTATATAGAVTTSSDTHSFKRR